MNSAANTAYPCRKATCCGEDDPFPNFTQNRLGYNSARLEAVQCVSYYTPPLPPPLVIPVALDPCLDCTAECIVALDNVTDECGEEFTSESYLCAIKKGDNCCKPGQDQSQPIVEYCNTAQTCVAYCADGTPFSYTVPAGSVCAASQAEADASAYSIACLNASSYKFCFLDLPSRYVCVGTLFVDYINITGPPGVYTWSLVYGALPPGLVLGALTGTSQAIAGTPTIHGTWSFIIRVTDVAGRYIEKLFTMYSIEISPSMLQGARIGRAYSQQLIANGVPGGASLAWGITHGHLPTGLTLSASGLISGTPTADVPSTFTVGVAIT